MSKGKPLKKRQRVWEIDAFRGLLIFGVLCFHLYFTVDAFCINGYYNIDSYAYVNATDPLHFWFDWGEDGVIYEAFLTAPIRNTLIAFGVNCFLVISGISCQFSRDNLKSAFRLLAAGYALTAFTFGLYLWTGEPSRFSRFGPLLCYAYCHLIYTLLLEKRSNKTLLVVAALVLAVGYYIQLRPVYLDSVLFLPLGLHAEGAAIGEYAPLLPKFGWLLFGVVLGRRYYSKKKSLLPCTMADKLTRPLQWLGRHSGVIYLSHIVIYTAVFSGIGYIFKLL